MLRRLLPPLCLLAPFLGALDAALVRLRLAWRPHGAELFGQAALLWFLLGLVALVPAVLLLRLLERGRAEDPRGAGADRGRAAGVLTFLLVLPVAAHRTLDSWVGAERDLSALRGAAPWLALAGVLLATAFAGLLAATLARRLAPRRLVPGLLTAALVVGLVPPRGAGGRSAGAAGAPAAGPNLLLLIWDTTRPDALTPYGADRDTTPELARLAEESVVFERATAPATFTFTSHLSMLAGVYPSTHGARLLSRRYDPRRATSVAVQLRSAGYRTAAFVGTDVLAGRTGIRHGFEVYDDRVDPAVCDTLAWALVHDLQAVAAEVVPSLSRNGNPHWFQDFQRPGEEVLTHALRWIGEDDPRPWFCMVNLYDVHWPYLPQGAGRDLVGTYDGPLDGYLFRSDAWRPGTELTEADLRHVFELYEGELLDLDLAVDRFLERLDLGAGRTAVLMTSDHGEAFGEGGRWKHEDIGEPEVRIPLILRPAAPGGLPGGRRVARRASGVDVGPTLLELAGLEVPPEVEGESLVPFLGPDAPAAGARVVFVEDRDHLDPEDVRVALYRDSWKLVRRGLGEEASVALFDLAADPLGEVDVAAEHPDLLAELLALLEERRAGRDAADAEVEEGGIGIGAGLQQLGYVGDDEEPR